MSGLKTNQRLELAYNYLMYTGENVFLTGKAGTGKTTFLKQLREISPKRMVVAAPTGVAAINAGGVTLHSLFQLSFGPQIPGQYKPSNQFTRTKLDLIRSIDLLVIDEISMVRADLLDAVDATLKRIRHNKLPFGGVQLLLIGDMQQLAPVVTRNEEAVLQQYYSTYYFFGSIAWQNTKYVGIELNEIFRQTDNTYISILNAIREGNATPQTVENLNKRYIPNYVPPKDDDIITLVTHNNMADRINSSHLAALPGEEKIFTAEIKGDFPETSYPVDKNLVLKIGATVMFIKNDTSYQKLFFNGKIGRITGFDDEGVIIKCKDDANSIHVEPMAWENKRYTIDENTKEIKEKTIGTFSQLPLRTAWAVTIHKSQGLTFNRMMLDTSNSFTHGQAYVALSRCRTLEGLILLQPFSLSDIICDPTIKQFSQNVEQNIPDNKKLVADRRNYFFDCIADLFNFKILFSEVSNLVRKFSEVKTALGNIEVFDNVESKINQEMIVVSEKFVNVIKYQFANSEDLEADETLISRISNGCKYYLTKLSEIVSPSIEKFGFDCDDKEKKAILREAYELLVNEFSFRKKLIESVENKFVIKDFLSSKAKLKLSQNKPDGIGVKFSFTPQPMELSSKNAELYSLLSNWRKDRAGELGVEPKDIVKTSALKDVADNIPTTYSEISKIKGLGGSKGKKIVANLLEIVLNYQKSKGKSVDFNELKRAQLESLSTYEHTKQLLNQGLTVSEIAKKRHLATSTVVGHLIKFVAKGEVSATSLMDADRLNFLKKYIVDNQNFATLSELHEALEQKYTFDEIRIAQADLEFDKM